MDRFEDLMPEEMEEVALAIEFRLGKLAQLHAERESDAKFTEMIDKKIAALVSAATRLGVHRAAAAPPLQK